MNLFQNAGKSIGKHPCGSIASSLAAMGCLMILCGWAPRATAASVTVGSANVASGANAILPLTIDSGTQPLGRYEVFLRFDTNDLRIVSYVSTSPDFSGPVVNTNIAGQVNVVCDSTSGSLNTPTGVVQVAQITFQAIGSPGDSPTVTIDSKTLYDAQTTSEIPASVNDGSVSILSPPVAAFSGSPTNGFVSLDVTFTDSSTGTITNRFWDFGDGDTLTTSATSVPHTYDAAGVYDVTLIVCGPGGSDTNTISNYITANNLPPAALNVTPVSRDFGSLVVGQTNTLSFSVINTGGLSLTGTAAVAGPFAISSGGSFVVAPGQTGTVSVSFLPGSPGTFSNRVVFSSNGGASSNTVTGAAVTPGALAVSPLAFDFGALATGATAQTSFVVTNTGGSAVSGSASIGGAPFSILSGTPFNLPGFGSTNVVVKFSPTVEGGFSNNVLFALTGATLTNRVTGTGAIAPVAGFDGTPPLGEAPLPVTFADISTGTITNRHWDFGDGHTTNTTSASVPHTYASAGTNTVILTVSGPLGSDARTRTGYIVVTNASVDQTGPLVVIDTPADYAEFTNANLVVTGTASDASGIQDVTVNGAVANLAGANWSRGITLATGTNLITVIARDNSAAMNASTQFVHAIFTAPSSGGDTNPPTVRITSPTNGFSTTERFIEVLGHAADDTVLASVTITNNRGGAVVATLTGTNFTASPVSLRLGTNRLYAVAVDGSTHTAQDMITVVRVNTNYVNTTLRVTKAKLSLGGPGDDSLTLSGVYNDADATYQETDTGAVVFGDYDESTPSNAVVNLKFKAKASPTNSLTKLTFNSKKRTVSLKTSGMTLTNLSVFPVAVALGAADFGQDQIAFAGAVAGGGKYSWTYGKQFPLVDQFFLGKGKLTTNDFNLSGTIYIADLPNPLAEPVYFGIGAYEETLATNLWAKGTGNVYTYTRPSGQATGLKNLTLDFDKGEWKATGDGVDLGFLASDPNTEITLEAGGFGARYRAKLVPNGTKFGY